MTADPKPDSATADLPCHEYGYAADVDKAEAWDAISAKSAEITRLRAELAEARESAQSAHAVGFAAGIEAAIASIMKHSNIARRRMAECYDELDPDGYNGWGDIVSHLDIELGAIRALTPPDITAAAARVLLDDLALALSTEIGAAGGKEAGRRWSTAHDAAESAPTTMSSPTPIQMIRAALRALAEVKP